MERKERRGCSGKLIRCMGRKEGKKKRFLLGRDREREDIFKQVREE